MISRVFKPPRAGDTRHVGPLNRTSPATLSSPLSPRNLIFSSNRVVFFLQMCPISSLHTPPCRLALFLSPCASPFVHDLSHPGRRGYSCYKGGAPLRCMGWLFDDEGRWSRCYKGGGDVGWPVAATAGDAANPPPPSWQSMLLQGRGRPPASPCASSEWRCCK